MDNHSLFDEKASYEEILKHYSRFDIAYRCISSETKTCLILNNNKENISKNISNIFDDIYSVEVDKKSFLLPFKNEFFDLIIFSGLDLKDEIEIEKCFQDIKRVMKPSGCFCVSTRNSSGLNILNRKNLESTKKFYSNNYNGYIRIFNKSGFIIKPYWIIGNSCRPYFIGSIENVGVFRWLFSNIDKFLLINPKSKIIIWILKKIKFSFTKKFIKIFSPSFLFYCYKEAIPNQFEIMVKEKTGFTDMLQQIRFTKNIFILFDKNGNPKKRLLCKRKRTDSSDEIFFVNGPPKNGILKNKMVLVDWVEGKKANFNNLDELKLIFQWLFDFQSRTNGPNFDENTIKHEINEIKDNLADKNYLEKTEIEKWLLDYSNHSSKINTKTTGVHGDFAPHNILIKTNELSLNVIDWDRFFENGSPFYDIAKVVYHVLTPNSCVDEFITNVRSMEENSAIQIIDNLLSEHFQNKINLITILRYYFLKDLALNDELNKQYFISLLKELSKID